MLPSDLASRPLATTSALQKPVTPDQQIVDKLSDFAPGQRLMAEIQAILPNGAYRAIIAQRDITLALPFSAKAGDSLELEVVENNGRMTLAVVAHRDQTTGTSPGERPAVETTLSRTGNFIAGLLGKGDEGEGAKPAPLNANQPIATAPPTKAADLVPLLRQAIVQSGMFYESHQAQWVSNRLPTEALLTEPQGKLSSLAAEQAKAATQPAHATAPNPAVTVETAAPIAAAASKGEAEALITAQNTTQNTTTTDQARTTTAAASPTATQLVATELVPLVQQQLEALANQTYIWQGLAWPGQPMRWEIEEEGRRNAEGEPEASTPWQTRLTLTMPDLGEVRAALRLSGGEITLNLSAEDNAAAARLTGGSDELRQQLEAAGLTLSGFTVGRHERPET